MITTRLLKIFYVLPIALVVLASSAWAIDKLTLRSGTGEETTIQLNGSPSVKLSFENDQLILDFPTMDFRVKCLGEVTEDGYCYLSATTTVEGGGVATFAVSGSVSGLSSGQSVSLTLNGGGTIVVASNGEFMFGTKLSSGASYVVSVSSAPSGASCSVTNGSGTISANVSNVLVSCSTQTQSYSVGGSVSGLASGKSVSLTNNGGDSTTVSTNGAFTFATKVASGGAYSVSVSSQPAGQSCSVANGSGVVSANISNVTVTCADSPVTAAAYCQNTPDDVICDPDLPELLEGSPEITIRVPASRTLSIPSTLEEGTTGRGYLEYYSVDYTPYSQGYVWKFWYSRTPGGPVIETEVPDKYELCQDQKHPENTYFWTQNPDDYYLECYLGKAGGVVYLNWAYLNSAGVKYPSVGSFKVTMVAESK